MDLRSLYRAVMMDNYKNPKNKGLTKDKDYKFVHLNNPSCGDDMNVEIKVVDGKIEAIHHDGHGCSICCSSASVMSETLKGKTLEEANKKANELVDTIKCENLFHRTDIGAKAYRK